MADMESLPQDVRDKLTSIVQDLQLVLSGKPRFEASAVSPATRREIFECIQSINTKTISACRLSTPPGIHPEHDPSLIGFCGCLLRPPKPNFKPGIGDGSSSSSAGGGSGTSGSANSSRHRGTPNESQGQQGRNFNAYHSNNALPLEDGSGRMLLHVTMKVEHHGIVVARHRLYACAMPHDPSVEHAPNDNNGHTWQLAQAKDRKVWLDTSVGLCILEPLAADQQHHRCAAAATAQQGSGNMTTDSAAAAMAAAAAGAAGAFDPLAAILQPPMARKRSRPRSGSLLSSAQQQDELAAATVAQAAVQAAAAAAAPAAGAGAPMTQAAGLMAHVAVWPNLEFPFLDNTIQDASAQEERLGIVPAVAAGAAAAAGAGAATLGGLSLEQQMLLQHQQYQQQLLLQQSLQITSSDAAAAAALMPPDMAALSFAGHPVHSATAGQLQQQQQQYPGHSYWTSAATMSMQQAAGTPGTGLGFMASQQQQQQPAAAPEPMLIQHSAQRQPQQQQQQQQQEQEQPSVSSLSMLMQKMQISQAGPQLVKAFKNEGDVLQCMMGRSAAVAGGGGRMVQEQQLQQLLLEQDIRDAAHNSQRNVLHLVATNSLKVSVKTRLQRLELLLSNKALATKLMQQVNNNGSTPLMVAVTGVTPDNRSVFDRLLREADLEVMAAVSNSGWSVLHCLANQAAKATGPDASAQHQLLQQLLDQAVQHLWTTATAAADAAGSNLEQQQQQQQALQFVQDMLHEPVSEHYEGQLVMAELRQRMADKIILAQSPGHHQHDEHVGFRG